MTVSIEQAKITLAELIDQSAKGEPVEITRAGQTVAKLVSALSFPKRQRKPGFAKDLIRIIADDDEHLTDFTPYM